jgi:16S rRNA (guanine527-N7)-methyltransferase
MELILKYFPDLSERQKEQLEALGPLYREWNDKINVISRKDIDHLYKHHILHSLAMAKYYVFQPSELVLDVGTGGGFPGIPLAILFPETNFTLLDSTAKKIHVVNEVAKAVELENVTGIHARVEDHKGQYDLIISRAVTTLTQMVAWTKHLIPSHHWLIFKGGNPTEIRKELPPLYKVNSVPVTSFIDDPYFTDKYIVEVKKTN